MLTRIHPFTSLAALLVGLAAVPYFLGQPLIAVGFLVLAHGFVQLEFKKYTSNYQFILMLVTALAIGIFLDLRHSTWPMLTLAMLLASTAILARQAFMQRFTYVNLLWLDSGMALAAAGLYALAISGRPFAWDLWLAPLLPIVGALGLTFNYVQDGLRIRRSARFGYKVQVGQQAIDFELPDQTGQMRRVSEFTGRHPVLLVFVRGETPSLHSTNSRASNPARGSRNSHRRCGPRSSRARWCVVSKTARHWPRAAHRPSNGAGWPAVRCAYPPCRCRANRSR